MRLAVDGGATNLRIALLTDDGDHVRTERLSGFQWTTGEDPVAQQRRLVVAGWEAVGSPKPVESIGLGLAGGAKDRESRERLAPLIAESLGAHLVLLTGDDVTNHLGVLGGEPGVVVAAGTGVACVAVTSSGSLHNVDGLGYLFGDLGGGFSVGLAGFRAALAAVEGRGPATSLVGSAEAIACTPGTPLPLAVRTWYRRPTLIADIAAFAVPVVEAAAAGDAVALSICRTAGEDLATSVRAAIEAGMAAGGFATGVRVSWSGSVLRSPEVFEAFAAKVSSPESKEIELVQPKGDSMAGAVRLAVGGPDVDLPHRAAVVVAGPYA